MGDVALTLPAVRGVLNENSNVRITVLTRPFFAPFFANVEGLEVFTSELNGRHKGFGGLFKLFIDLKRNNHFDQVIDLHSVIRSRFISLLFRISGTKQFAIEKDRGSKKTYLTSDKEPQLEHTIDRYTKVFKKAGISCIPMLAPVINTSVVEDLPVEDYLIENDLVDKTLIGIAPYAKHQLKIWPEEQLKELISKLENNPNIRILLFGGGEEELNNLCKLIKNFKHCLIPSLNFKQELVLFQKLSMMLSMDSSNMHLAVLSGIPVISVWGATHPGIGFGAWMQDSKNAIQIPKSELECRPCTIYGKGECRRGDFACMNRINSELVFDRINQLISSKPSE